MATRFEVNIEYRAVGPGTSRLQGMHLRVWPAIALMIALSDHLTVFDDDTANQGIGTHQTSPLSSQCQSLLHVNGVSRGAWQADEHAQTAVPVVRPERLRILLRLHQVLGLSALVRAGAVR